MTGTELAVSVPFELVCAVELATDEEDFVVIDGNELCNGSTANIDNRFETRSARVRTSSVGFLAVIVVVC
jgi:hypothetical protein